MSTNPYGFIGLPVTDATIERAKQLRAMRDRRFRSSYAELDTDLRWVDELGEICFADWLPLRRLPMLRAYLFKVVLIGSVMLGMGGQNDAQAVDWATQLDEGKFGRALDGRSGPLATAKTWS